MTFVYENNINKRKDTPEPHKHNNIECCEFLIKKQSS